MQGKYCLGGAKDNRRIVIVLCEYLYKTTHKKKTVLSGGVALNCVANGILKEKSPFEKYFLFPACGDNGTTAL